MSTIGSVTTPAVTTPTATTATTEAAKPAETAATTTPAKAADAFEQAKESPVALSTPAVEDDWAECEFDDTKSGGGGMAGIDPNFGRRIPG